MNHNNITSSSVIQYRDPQHHKQDDLRAYLVKELKDNNAFWSYSDVENSIVDDDTLIEKTLRYLDLDEIKILFEMFNEKDIKRVWLERLVPQGDYLYSLNKFIAWYYFKAKRPGQYVKTMETKYINKRFA